MPPLRALAETSSRHQPCERHHDRQFAVANRDAAFCESERGGNGCGCHPRFWSNCIKCLRCIRNILIFWLNLVSQEGCDLYKQDSSRIGRIFEMLRNLRLQSSISKTQSASPNFPEFRSARPGCSIIFRQAPWFDLKTLAIRAMLSIDTSRSDLL